MPLSDDENAFLKQELAWAIDNYDFLRQELAWVMDNYVPATEDIHALADHKTKIAQLLKEVR